MPDEMPEWFPEFLGSMFQFSDKLEARSAEIKLALQLEDWAGIYALVNDVMARSLCAKMVFEQLGFNNE